MYICGQPSLEQAAELHHAPIMQIETIPSVCIANGIRIRYLSVFTGSIPKPSTMVLVMPIVFEAYLSLEGPVFIWSSVEPSDSFLVHVCPISPP